MRVRTVLTIPALFVALVATSAVQGAAQSASAILTDAYERHQSRMRGVENYTLIQESLGTETLLYFERDESVGGEGTFVPRVFRVGGRDMGSMTGLDGGDDDLWGPFGSFPAMAERARYDGRESLGGRSAHKIVVDDLSGIRMTPGVGGPQEEPFEARSVVLYLDAEELIPLRMDLEAVMEEDGTEREVTATSLFSDYRNVEGMLYPFRMDVEIEGMVPPDVSAEDQEEARRALEQMKAELENLPEDQRSMVGTMMKGQLERLERMVASGKMEIDVVVKELRVNEGPPAG